MRSSRMAVLVSLLVAMPLGARVLPPGIHPFRTYGAAAGLTNLAAMKLAQDTTGFLWVATQDGVYRFDGNRFERFGIERGLPSSYVTSVQSAPDGAVWAATYGGAARFDGRRFVLAAGLPKQQPNALAIDDIDQAWVAMPQGLFRQSAGGMFAAVPGWNAGEATGVWFDPRSRTMLAAANGVVGQFANGRWTWWRGGLLSERLDSVVADRDGTIWTRSAAHLFAKAANESAFRNVQSLIPATSTNGYLSIDRAGNLWIPTDKGVAVHDAAGWRVIGAKEGLPTEWARDVLEDREGSIWIASLGVYRMLGRGEFTSHLRSSGLPNDVTWCFHWDAAGRLLVGTDMGLLRARPDGWDVVPGTEADQVRTLVEEPDGTLWTGGSPPQVVRIGRDGIHRYGIPDGVHGRTIQDMARGADGTLFVGTRGGGLLRKAPRDAQFSQVSLPAGTADETFRRVITDSHGGIWAAGEHGLAHLDPETAIWRRYTRQDGLAADYVNSIAETAAGDFWVSYFEPLGAARVRFDADGNLHVLEPLAVGKVYMIGEDAHHRVWIGGGMGVDVIDGKVMLHYGTADGLACDDVDANAFHADPNGDVFIGTSAGFSHYVPRPDPPRIDPPPVRLMSTSAGKNEFETTFAALTYFKEDLVEYQTRLVGLDDEWRDSKTRDARFDRLAPGDYRFEMRARIRPGPWSAPATFAFPIEPAWWQTNWARGGAFLLLVALIGLAFRGRVAYLRRHNAELQALVEQRTHELAEANGKLLNLSVTDALTGMRNRRYLELCMPEYTGDALRNHERLSRSGIDPSRGNADLLFFLLDLDGFKDVNDRHGHLAGDRVLVDLHVLLAATLRESDTLIRWGGEELLIIGRNSSRYESFTIAERIRTTVESAPFLLDDGTVLQLTCSIGFAPFPFLPEDPARVTWQEVVDVADICLYAAKNRGKNRSVGVMAGDCEDPETLIPRIRRSLDDVVDSGELILCRATLPRACPSSR